MINKALDDNNDDDDDGEIQSRSTKQRKREAYCRRICEQESTFDDNRDN